MEKTSYICSTSCRQFSTSVYGISLMLSILLCSDVSLSLDIFMLGALNVRSVRHKGPLLASIVTSHDLDFLCLTETHVRLSGMDSFPWSITPPDSIFLQRPCPSGFVGGVGFFHSILLYTTKIESPVYRSISNMVLSVGLHGCSLLFACIYSPPGSCTCNC